MKTDTADSAEPHQPGAPAGRRHLVLAASRGHRSRRGPHMEASISRPRPCSTEQRTAPVRAAGRSRPHGEIRSRHATGLRLLWPLCVLLVTPLVLLSGVIALAGLVVLEAGRRLAAAQPRGGRTPLGPVVQLDSAPATDSLSSAA